MNGTRDLMKTCSKAEALSDHPYLVGSGLYHDADDTLAATFDGIDAYRLEVFMACRPESLYKVDSYFTNYPIHEVTML